MCGKGLAGRLSKLIDGRYPFGGGDGDGDPMMLKLTGWLGE